MNGPLGPFKLSICDTMGYQVNIDVSSLKRDVSLVTIKEGLYGPIIALYETGSYSDLQVKLHG